MIVILYFLISSLQYLFYRLLPLLDFINAPKIFGVLLVFMMSTTHEVSFCLPLPLIEQIQVNADFLFTPEAKKFLSLPVPKDLDEAQKIFQAFYQSATSEQLNTLLGQAPNNINFSNFYRLERPFNAYTNAVIENALITKYDYSFLDKHENPRIFVKTRVAEQVFVDTFLNYKTLHQTSFLRNPYYSLLYTSSMMDRDSKEVCSRLVERIQGGQSFNSYAGSIKSPYELYGVFVNSINETMYEVD